MYFKGIMNIFLVIIIMIIINDDVAISDIIILIITVTIIHVAMGVYELDEFSRLVLSITSAQAKSSNSIENHN